MISDENAGMQPSPQDALGRDDAPNRTRRRLIVGAASVLPTVYTLSSGAQTATASNARCLRDPPLEPERFAPTRDEWLRAPVYVGSYQGQAAYCITSPQELCVDVWNPNQAATGSQWIVDGSIVTAGPGTTIDLSKAGRQYGLIYVDREGTIAALDPSAAPDIQPSTASCWASVMGSWNAKL